MKMSDKELQTLLDHWREGALTEEEMRGLAEQLEAPDARQMMRQDWFLDAALPQSLAASDVLVRAPKPSFAARCQAWLAGGLPRFMPTETSTPARNHERPPTLWERLALGTVPLAAAIAIACVVWDRTAPRPDATEAFAAELIAASLEP
jgi:hypothetical protein